MERAATGVPLLVVVRKKNRYDWTCAWRPFANVCSACREFSFAFKRKCIGCIRGEIKDAGVTKVMRNRLMQDVLVYKC